MKYEAPELYALTPAINAIQNTKDAPTPITDGAKHEVTVGAYQDWE
jgi:hypothetical protein